MSEARQDSGSPGEITEEEKKEYMANFMERFQIGIDSCFTF